MHAAQKWKKKKTIFSITSWFSSNPHIEHIVVVFFLPTNNWILYLYLLFLLLLLISQITKIQKIYLCLPPPIHKFLIAYINIFCMHQFIVWLYGWWWVCIQFTICTKTLAYAVRWLLSSYKPKLWLVSSYFLFCFVAFIRFKFKFGIRIVFAGQKLEIHLICFLSLSPSLLLSILMVKCKTIIRIHITHYGQYMNKAHA